MHQGFEGAWCGARRRRSEFSDRSAAIGDDGPLTGASPPDRSGEVGAQVSDPHLCVHGCTHYDLFGIASTATLLA